MLPLGSSLRGRTNVWYFSLTPVLLSYGVFTKFPDSPAQREKNETSLWAYSGNSYLVICAVSAPPGCWRAQSTADEATVVASRDKHK